MKPKEYTTGKGSKQRKKDRRYLVWLTADGVRAVTAERDTILKVQLPLLRKGTAAEVTTNRPQRKQLMRRVLILNQWLHYNSNKETNGTVAREQKQVVYSLEISKEHAAKLGFVMEKIAEAGVDITRNEAAEHCIDWAHHLITKNGSKVRAN